MRHWQKNLSAGGPGPICTDQFSDILKKEFDHLERCSFFKTVGKRVVNLKENGGEEEKLKFV